MRYFVALIFFLFYFVSALSQDTVHFRDGVVKVVKVTEITTSEIKYHSFDNLEGPLYSLEKNKVSFIKYKDGYIDSIPKTTVVENKIPSGKIYIRGFTLLYCEKKINDRQFLSMINENKNFGNKQTLQYEFNLMRIYSNRRNNFGAAGGVSALSAIYAPLFILYVSGPSPALVAFAIFGTITIATTTFAIINKNNYRKQRVKTAQLYNSFN